MRYAASSFHSCTQLVLDIAELYISQMCVGTDQSKLTIPFFKQFSSWGQLSPNFSLPNLCIKLRHLKDW